MSDPIVILMVLLALGVASCVGLTIGAIADLALTRLKVRCLKATRRLK